MNILQLTWTSPVSNDACDVDEDNPVNRALNALLDGGRPIRSFSMCHLKVPPEAEEPTELRWVGVFVHSQGGPQGGRILYFPGFSYDRFHAFQGTTPRTLGSFSIDHLSLEPDFRNWHLTSFKSQRHSTKSFPTCALDDGRYLWFGLSIVDLNVFRPVCRETQISVPSPPTDSRRRIDAFMSSRKDSKDLWVGLSPGATTAFDQYFIHLAVVAGPKGFSDYVGPKLGFPEGSPFLTAPLPDGPLSLSSRRHRMTLSDEIDLQIVLTCLPGSLGVPAHLTGIGDR